VPDIASREGIGLLNPANSVKKRKGKKGEGPYFDARRKIKKRVMALASLRRKEPIFHRQLQEAKGPRPRIQI